MVYEELLKIELNDLSDQKVASIITSYVGQPAFGDVVIYMGAVYASHKAGLGSTVDPNQEINLQIITEMRFVNNMTDSGFATLKQLLQKHDALVAKQAALGQIAAGQTTQRDTLSQEIIKLQKGVPAHAMAWTVHLFAAIFAVKNVPEKQVAVNKCLSLVKIIDAQFSWLQAVKTFTVVLNEIVMTTKLKVGTAAAEADEAKRQATAAATEAQAAKLKIETLEREKRDDAGTGITKMTFVQTRDGLLSPGPNLAEDLLNMRNHWSELRCFFLSFIRLEIEVQRDRLINANKILQSLRDTLPKAGQSSFTYLQRDPEAEKKRDAAKEKDIAEKEARIALQTTVLNNLVIIYFRLIDEQGTIKELLLEVKRIQGKKDTVDYYPLYLYQQNVKALNTMLEKDAALAVDPLLGFAVANDAIKEQASAMYDKLVLLVGLKKGGVLSLLGEKWDERHMLWQTEARRIEKQYNLRDSSEAFASSNHYVFKK